MIVHRHRDGSEGYQYELGDVVKIKDVIAGGWFRVAVGRTGPIVWLDERCHWRTRRVDVKDRPDWGPSGCFPWMVEPTADTKITAYVAV